MIVKPTLAFVHGAFADSSSWSDTLFELDRHGYPAIAIPNELRGLRSDATYVQSVLDTIDGPVVLVGHSYGGAVIGEAARNASNVVALVFIAAFILDEGESIATVLDPGRFPGALLGPATTIARPFYNHSTGAGDDDLYIQTDDFARVFAADVPAKVVRAMSLAQRPISTTAFTGVASSDPAWKSLPSWALLAEQDNAIPAAGQRWMAERAGATVAEVQSSHAVMVSSPDSVTSLVMAVVQSLE